MSHHHKGKRKPIVSTKLRGSRGFRGCTGTTGLAAWGYVYQIGAESIAQGAPVDFSNNGPLNGITHTVGTSEIGITVNGTYNIAFSVYTTNNNPQDWGIAVNGIIQAEFNSAGQSITGIASLVLNAGDRVTLRNVATLPDPATLRPNSTTTAQVLIYKVDS